MYADEELGFLGSWGGWRGGCEGEVLFEGGVGGAVEPGFHC